MKSSLFSKLVSAIVRRRPDKYEIEAKLKAIYEQRGGQPSLRDIIQDVMDELGIK